MVFITSFQSHILGAVAALLSAFCWAVAAILFRRIGDHVPAMGINLAKGLVAMLFMAVLLLPGFYSSLALVDANSLAALALSGIIGICFGDTLYFLTLMRLGARRTLLLGSLIPVTTAFIAVVFLGEQISALAWFGMSLAIVGVTYVLWQRAPQENTQQQSREKYRSGLFFGLLFVAANALGIIATKVGVADIPALEATFVRQVFAIAGLTFWGLMVRDLLGWVSPLRNGKRLKTLLAASLIGALLGTWLSIVALKYTYAAVAATLNSTSPLFILPLAVFWLKEHVTLREIIGALTAVAGIGLYFSSLSL
ncbi:MAG TPA: DMT family transporter [Gammaproteobacteria bacterium]|nr:DMT family transporter [Gammaproteobacteria bacterium]